MKARSNSPPECLASSETRGLKRDPSIVRLCLATSAIRCRISASRPLKNGCRVTGSSRMRPHDYEG